MPGRQIFDKAALEKAFAELGKRAQAAGKTIEISIYGGSALILTFDQRPNTRDVDGVFEKDKEFVRALAIDLANEYGWDHGWLNDGVKGWLSVVDSKPEAKTFFKSYPSESEPGLQVSLAKPEYLFAMKCRAMRTDAASSDIDDIKLLAGQLGLTNSEAALALIAKFYPHNVLEPKTRFGLEEIFSCIDWGRRK
jgi:hypothetical protein